MMKDVTGSRGSVKSDIQKQSVGQAGPRRPKHIEARTEVRDFDAHALEQKHVQGLEVAVHDGMRQPMMQVVHALHINKHRIKC